MPDVFISHVSEDRATAEAIAAELEQSGYTTWYYERDALPGMTYLAQTRRAIDESRSFLLLVSSSALERHRQVEKELVRAHETGIPIVPLFKGVDFATFQANRPDWHQAIGATVGIEMAGDDVPSIMRRVIAGLGALGISRTEEGDRRVQSQRHALPDPTPTDPRASAGQSRSSPEDAPKGLNKARWQLFADARDNSGDDDPIAAFGIRIVSEDRARLERAGQSIHKIREGATVGIDLGTTYSAIAQLDSTGVPVSLPNADGQPITPSIVLLGDDGNVLIGPSCERMSIEDPRRIVEAIKRQMGNSGFSVDYQNKKLTPEFISALILRKLKQDAEKTIGPIANAVITVPYYFNEHRRRATQNAGRIAGLNVIDIINEPIAATLAYAWQRGELGRQDLVNKERTILVYDLGGGTFDVAVVRYTPTSFRVLATDGDVMCGGLDWTRRIVDHIAEQFHRKFNEDPRDDPESMMNITHACEDAKRVLSTKAQVPINCYYKGKTLAVAMTREDFERMTSDLMQNTKDTTELVMEQAGVKKGQLDDVVLVGGSTYMPVVEVMLREVTGRAPSRAVVPEEAVAQGACIHAAILEARATGGDSRLAQLVIKRLQSTNLSDVNSHSLGILVRNDDGRHFNHIMIPKNSPIPHRVKQQFATRITGQRSIHIRILEGEAEDPRACSMVGDFRVTDLPPSLPAGSPVEITYEYDKNGLIHAHARELSSGRAAESRIDRKSGCTSSELDSFERLLSLYQIE